MAIRLALSRYFARRGWSVCEAENGQAALARIRQSARDYYSVIVSDVQMPGLSGIELHRILADERPDLIPRFILCTGNSSAEGLPEFVARTNCTVIAKPFELSVLDKLFDRIEQAGD